MKKTMMILLVLLLCSSGLLVACNVKSISISSKIDLNKTNVVKKYYISGSWNFYRVNDEKYIMKLVPGSSTFYTITVDLTAAARNTSYDGHWYKITEGNWSGAYGIDSYALQPAPVKKNSSGQVIGMGSIWIDANMSLTIMFDSDKKIVYDNADGKVLPTP